MRELHAPVLMVRYRGYVAESLSNQRLISRIEAEIEHAIKSQVWFSPLSSQNDPFDTNPYYIDSSLYDVNKFLSEWRRKKGPYASFSGIDYRERRKELGIPKSKMKKAVQDTNSTIKIARKVFQNTRKDQKICSFSTDYLNVLMWSYYAHQHESFC